MKKILSFLLILSIVCSFPLSFSAEESETPIASDADTIRIHSDEVWDECLLSFVDHSGTAADLVKMEGKPGEYYLDVALSDAYRGYILTDGKGAVTQEYDLRPMEKEAISLYYCFEDELPNDENDEYFYYHSDFFDGHECWFNEDGFLSFSVNKRMDDITFSKFSQKGLSEYVLYRGKPDYFNGSGKHISLIPLTLMTKLEDIQLKDDTEGGFPGSMYLEPGNYGITITPNENGTYSLYIDPNDERCTRPHITVHYIDAVDPTNPEHSSECYYPEVGQAYTILPRYLFGFKLDTDRYPSNSSGIFNGESIDVTFYYVNALDKFPGVAYYNNTWNNAYGVGFSQAYDDKINHVRGSNIFGDTFDLRTKMSKTSVEGDNHWFYHYERSTPLSYTRPLIGGKLYHYYGYEFGVNYANQWEPYSGYGFSSTYQISDTAYIKDGVVNGRGRVVTSYIDADTGEKLAEDTVRIYDSPLHLTSWIYTTAPKDIKNMVAAAPSNASGKLRNGTQNVVYLYHRNSDVQPTVATDVTLTDKATDISVTIGEKDSVAALNVRKLEKEEISPSIIGNLLAAYDISLTKDHTEIQPDGSLTLKIPSDNPTAKVYRVENDNRLSDMHAEYKDGYLVCDTERLGVFVVTQKTQNIILGDVDGDGNVTIIDATGIQRHLASIPTLTYIEEAADADEDGHVTILDATGIQKHLANLPSNENIGKPI